MKLNILTYNIHKGFNWNNSRLILNDIRQMVRSTNADLVFLQEVVGENKLFEEKRNDWLKVPQYEFLADSIWNDFAYAKNAVYDQRHHGNVILSKYPITKWEQIPISTNRYEQRGVLFCEIQTSETTKVHAYCVHLDLTPKGRNLQYQKLVEIITLRTPKDVPLLIAGDFNDWDQQACYSLEEKLQVEECFKRLNGNYAKTFPVFLPVLALDRLYSRHYRPQKGEILKNSMWRKLSDHAALYVEGHLI